MNNIVTDCVRCKGRGTISCPTCSNRFGITLTPYGSEYPCQTCKGVKELNCPACLGKAKVSLPDVVDALNLVDKPSIQQHKRNSEFTTARQVLAIHALLDASNANLDNKSDEVRFIEFLTGKNSDSISIKLTEIRERGNRADKRSKKAVPRSLRSRKEDLHFIKPFFEKLALTKIMNAIEDEIKEIEQDHHNA